MKFQYVVPDDEGYALTGVDRWTSSPVARLFISTWKRHIIIVDRCCLCKREREREYVDHILLHYDVAYALWTNILNRFGLIFTMPAHSMRFDLVSGITKCISEDIKSNFMTVGKYSVINPSEGFPVPDAHKITVRVTSPQSSSYHYGDNVEAGNFAFTAAESGDYTACFWAPDHKPPVTVTVDFDWRTGVAAKDWSKVAKKGQLEVMELELKKLYDTVTSIHDEMFYLREREEEMQQLNRATNSKMATFSFLSIVVCLSVAGLQLWHLKTFFERKKLL